jgi:hypothetical protein
LAEAIYQECGKGEECIVGVAKRILALALTVGHFLVVMFIHASLRLRNLKNKLENKIEGIGLKKTPMGIVLDALEQQEENMSKFTDYISKVKD